MTMHELFGLVKRRWYIYAAGLLVASATVMWLGTTPRVFTATAELEFVQPRKLPDDLVNEDQRDTLIKFAGAVAHKYDEAHPNLQLSSPSASIFGNGLREGTAVQLAAVGNQWTTSFVRPVIQIQVASSNGDAVLPRIREIASAVESISVAMQQQAGTTKAYQITTNMDLDLVTVNSFGQTRTGRVSGAAVLLGACIVLATITGQLLDRVARFSEQSSKRRKSSDTSGLSHTD
ncbi:hypothetical protein ACTXL8_11150 [Glutamicibacter arilaitensis]|uniref:hypothetical protein n=1 Tax=Glutamicibacter arilaitensis TaxID=256701 RepID=UPI003FD00959